MVKILLASNNACKVVEIKALLKGYEIYAFGEILNCIFRHHKHYLLIP